MCLYSMAFMASIKVKGAASETMYHAGNKVLSECKHLPMENEEQQEKNQGN